MEQTSLGILPVLAMLLLLPLSIASLICFILVLVEMFRRDETTIGIVCLVLSLVTGIGALVAFVYGWMKVSEWQLKKVMITWTACLAATVLLVVVYIAAGAAFLLHSATPPPPARAAVERPI